MGLFKKLGILLSLALFLLGSNCCKAQEEKSQKAGKAVMDTMKEAEKKIDEAAEMMQEKLNQLEEDDK